VAACSRIGRRAPGNCVASGKALQAEQLSAGTRDASQAPGYHPKGETTSPRSIANNRIHP